MWRFTRTSMAFMAGLALTMWAADGVVGWHARRTGHGLVGADVANAIHRATRPSPGVRAILLGDSVAHQLFPARIEPAAGVRYLASNQAISVAGQYYLLRLALPHDPDVRDVYFLYTPLSFGNDLGPPFSHDYFCGYFHAPDQIAEIFRARRDVRLAAVQLGRALLPNVLSFNSAIQPVVQTTAGLNGGGSVPEIPSDPPEPLLDVVNRVLGARRPASPPPQPPQRTTLYLSPTSRQFLAKMRELCAARGARLHVLACICSTEWHFDDAEHVYDEPILYEPGDRFADSIHFKAPYVEAVRQRMIDAYGLPGGTLAMSEHQRGP